MPWPSPWSCGAPSATSWGRARSPWVRARGRSSAPHRIQRPRLSAHAMALQIHVSGPGLDVTRRLAAGDPQLVLGRDADCDVCLPDPERTVSRRHLALWVEGKDLLFHVVSSVNGVE